MTVCISLFMENHTVRRRESIGISGLSWRWTFWTPILFLINFSCIQKTSCRRNASNRNQKRHQFQPILHVPWIIVVKWKISLRFAIDELIKPLWNQKHVLTFIHCSKFQSNILWNPSKNCSKASLNESCAENHSTDGISSVCAVHFPYGRLPWHWFGFVWKELHNRLTTQYEFSYNEVNIRIPMNWRAPHKDSAAQYKYIGN